MVGFQLLDRGSGLEINEFFAEQSSVSKELSAHERAANLARARQPFSLLMDAAPSDAVGSLRVTWEQSGSRVLFEICSVHHQFSAVARRGQMQNALDEVFAEIRQQLENWRERRFQ